MQITENDAINILRAFESCWNEGLFLSDDDQLLAYRIALSFPNIITGFEVFDLQNFKDF